MIYDESMSEPLPRTREQKSLEYQQQFAVFRSEMAENNRKYFEMTDNITYRAFTPTPETDQLLELMAAGVPLTQACELTGVAKCMVYKWAARDRLFAARYMEARVAQAWAISEELLEIADNVPADVAEVAKARIRIDTRKWLLSKVIPRIFGDKLEVTQDIKGSPQVNIILPGKGGSTPGLPPAPPDAAATITLSPNSSDPIDVTPKPSE